MDTLDLTALFADLIVDGNSHRAQYQTIDYLRACGWKCQMEYAAPDWGDGHKRFIDVMAVRDDIVLAIEIDRHIARKKSLRKLHDVKADYKVVLLRGGVTEIVDDILVIALKVNHG